MGEQITSEPHLKMAVVGGGTGLSTVLSGLKARVGEGLTGIINTFDSGGGTGLLRSELDMAAMGDLRKGVWALSDASPEATAALEQRFNNPAYAGQTLGNFMIAAAVLSNGGNLNTAIKTISDLFQVKGTILPASSDNLHLRFKLPDGTCIEGEHEAEIVAIPRFIGAAIGFDKEPTREGSEEAEAAILAADMVVYAPGDLYTSIGPVLAVPAISFALQKSDVPVVQVSNLMNREYQTRDYTTLDYVKEYDRIVRTRAISHVLYNNRAPHPVVLAEQAKLGSHPVRHDVAGMKQAGYEARGSNLLSDEKVIIDPDDPIGSSRSQIRHDPHSIALALVGLYYDIARRQAEL